MLLLSRFRVLDVRQCKAEEKGDSGSAHVAVSQATNSTIPLLTAIVDYEMMRTENLAFGPS